MATPLRASLTPPAVAGPVDRGVRHQCGTAGTERVYGIGPMQSCPLGLADNGIGGIVPFFEDFRSQSFGFIELAHQVLNLKVLEFVP